MGLRQNCRYRNMAIEGAPPNKGTPCCFEDLFLTYFLPNRTVHRLFLLPSSLFQIISPTTMVYSSFLFLSLLNAFLHCKSQTWVDSIQVLKFTVLRLRILLAVSTILHFSECGRVLICPCSTFYRASHDVEPLIRRLCLKPCQVMTCCLKEKTNASYFEMEFLYTLFLDDNRS